MKDSVFKSIALHIVVLIIFLIDLPFLGHRSMIDQVPIIVDLKDVKISAMTNLPPKAKRGKEEKEASKIKRKIENNFTTDKAKPQQEPQKTEKMPEPQPAKEEVKPVEPKTDFLVAPQPKKPPVPTKKPEPKAVPKPQPKEKTPKKEDKKTPELANPLKSLLASVDALEKNLGETDARATLKEDAEVNNMGIDGGVGGSYFSELSISEIDAIAGRLRACWNLDPGAMGIKDMIVEIRTYLNRDGTVKDVKILDTGRYSSDPHFRSVADSARRAVYICSEVYKIFPEKYPEKYGMWNVMLLRFNPLDGNIN